MKLGVIGCGAMAQAMLNRWLELGVIEAENVFVSNRRGQKVSLLNGELAPLPNQEVVDRADVVLVGVKPHQFDDVVSRLDFRDSQIVLSILAGTPLARVNEFVQPASGIRLMPNLPVGIGQGIVAAYGIIDDAELNVALEGLGLVVRLDQESDFDAVTAIAGSAPAFCFVFAQALSDAGVLHGLPRADSQRLAAKVLEGAGALLGFQDQSPESLKDQVASPKGTTIAGLRELEAKGFRSAIIEAVTASATRSRELSKG